MLLISRYIGYSMKIRANPLIKALQFSNVHVLQPLQIIFEGTSILLESWYTASLLELSTFFTHPRHLFPKSSIRRYFLRFL